MDLEQLRIADSCSCGVTIAPSGMKHSNADLSVFAARTLNQGDFIGPYYRTIVYYDISSRQPTRKMHGDGFLKVDVARFSKFALQLRVQGRRF